MRRVLPHPRLSVLLLVVWALLHASVAPGVLATGAVLALLGPLAMARLQPDRPALRSPGAVLRLAAVVFTDIVRSNYAVATLILGRRRRDRVSGFVYIPLDVRSPSSLAVLAIIVTSTPGTLWVQYDAGRGRLLLHVLDLVDEAEWTELIKGRYEPLLTEIFE